MKRDLLLAVLAPSLLGAQTDRVSRLMSAMPAVDKLIIDFTQRDHIPGAAWGVIIDGRLVHVGVTGFRDLATKSPVDATSVFRIASMTKSFTAMAILKLRDEGKLSLDDPVETLRAGARRPEVSDERFAEDHDPPSAVARGRISRRTTRGAISSSRDTDEQLSRMTALRHSVLQRARHRVRVLELRLRDPRSHRCERSGAAIRATTSRPHILRPLGMTLDDAESEVVPADRLAHGYRLGRRINGRRSRCSRRLVRVDGRDADVAQRSRPLCLGFLLGAWPPRDGAGDRADPPRSLREMQQVWRPAHDRHA